MQCAVFMCSYSAAVAAQEVEHEHKPIPAQGVPTKIGMTELMMVAVLQSYTP